MADLLHRAFGAGNGDILGDGFGEEEGLLQNDADIVAQMIAPDGADVTAVDGDAALARLEIIQTIEQIAQCALARSGAAQNTKGGSGRDGEGYVL